MIFSHKPPDPPDRIRHTDVIMRCPDCQAAGGVSLVIIRTPVNRDGQLISIPTGDRMACQRCPCVYSVDASGVFRHHPGSLPYTGGATPQIAAQAPPRPPDDPGPDQPLPRAKPRL